MSDLLRIVGLWRARTVWLLGGVVLSLMALGAAVGLSTLGGAAALSGGIATIAVLRAVGVGRVVLRYAERMVSHAAMFRALADVRLWFFRRLAGRSAGGRLLGHDESGDAGSSV